MKAAQTKEITFTLDADEAMKLYAFLTNDKTIPWGIDSGRQVAEQIEQQLGVFLGKRRKDAF